MEWSKDDLNNLKTIAKKDKIATEITVLFNKMSITITSITTTKTTDSIRAKYTELSLPYKVIKKVKSTKEARKRSIKKVKRKGTKNTRKGDTTVIASGGNILSISY